ncbi:uncharacterized protein [Paralichthys olivaceus]|uniref:uncharacterized protein n=1 Tax=Paralichthys olivaceus TaxID=8255 RepID=UPI003753E07F
MTENQLLMDPDKEEEEVFSDTDVLTPRPPLTPEEDEEEREKEKDEEKEKEREKEEKEKDEEEDARIFNAWMQRYRGGKQQEKPGEEEEEESDGGGTDSRGSLEPLVRVDRRASLPCPATLSAMQLSRLHSSTQAPVTARVLLRRTSSRRLLSSQQDAATLERRPSIIPTIPEAIPPERRGQFRRRNVMSLSDADSVCLICHNDLQAGSGTTELQCTHTFHKECIEERLWRKHSCPTCHVQVPQPVDWSSTRVKVP